jgi:glycosyltransferase involved in cell wall biosynthesis
LWFGSDGLVHKGLDLTLEAFAEMPEYRLLVCGPIEKERDFVQTYYSELYKTPNIHVIGWVDVTGQEFMKIIETCAGLVYPSCSEGQSGSVINCLHAGLIPIISYESGVDVDDFGLILRESSVDEIKNAVRTIAGLSSERLGSMALKAWDFARKKHTRDAFKEVFRQTFSTILNDWTDRSAGPVEK